MTGSGSTGGYPSPGPATAGSERRPGLARPVNWLLILPLIGTLVPEFYNRARPSIGGMPFFYWYQLAWIAVSVTCTWIVYTAHRGER